MTNNKNFPNSHEYLLKINNYVPGKSKINNSPEKIIKLSSNENALGCSKKALESYVLHQHEIHRYADGSCEKLREKLALKHNINANQIVCGAGSDEILNLITCAYAGIDDEIIYSEYGFLMYPISAQRVGAKPIKVKEKNLKIDVNNVLNAITKKTKIIFIANPNNPTGSYLNSQEISNLVANIPANVLLVLDHAYEEFVNVNDYYNGYEIVNKYPNVILTKTFSKIYGLASLRVGWSYSSLEIANILHKVRGPFNVSGPAQISAIASLDDEKFVQDSVDHNNKWLKIYATELAKLDYLKIYPSMGNFILIDFLEITKCQKINQKLLENGIIVRDVVSYGLPSCLRISIGSDFENNKVLNFLLDLKNGL